MPSRFRVVAGYLAGLVVFIFARPTPRSLLAALPLFVLGEVVRLWASGHIEKTQRLATGGPYAHTRNPLYAGSVLLAVAVAVACASMAAAAAEGLVVLLVVLVAAGTGCQTANDGGASTALGRALLLHASFDKGLDADFAVGDPKLFCRITFRPFGPSVTLTARASFDTPRRIASRASCSKAIIFAILSSPG
jgi:hypothetical protein